MDNPHEAVCHSVSQYVHDQAHNNGMESFWAMLKRGYQGTFHYFNPKHTTRYVSEFSGRHNIRERDTIEQMVKIVDGLWAVGSADPTPADLVSELGIGPDLPGVIIKIDSYYGHFDQAL